MRILGKVCLIVMKMMNDVPMQTFLITGFIFLFFTFFFYLMDMLDLPGDVFTRFTHIEFSILLQWFYEMMNCSM